MINNEDVKVQTVSISDTNLSRPAAIEIKSYLNSASAIAKTAKGNEKEFYKRMKVYHEKTFSSEFENISKSDGKKDLAKSQIGFLVMCMIYLSTLSTTIIVKDKLKRIYYRVIVGPIGMSNYVLQSIMSFFVVAALQVILIFTYMKYIIGNIYLPLCHQFYCHDWFYPWF